MTTEPSPPEGLTVTRTASGGFRIDLPRNRIPYVLAGLVGLLSLTYGAHQIWLRETAKPDGGNPLFLVLFGVMFLLLAYWSIRCSFGLKALEVDGEGVTRCFRLPPFSERRRHTPAGSITALAVRTFERPQSNSPYWLEAQVGKKRVFLASGLSPSELEWLRGRIAAVLEGLGETRTDDA